MIAFISCFKNYKKWKQIHNMCSKYKITEYIIVIANPTICTDISVGKYLILKCNDGYCDLPVKMYKLNKIILKLFPNISGYWKIDDDVKIKRNTENALCVLKKYDFAGFHLIDAHSQDGQWHISRCKDSKWNKLHIDIKQWSTNVLKYSNNFQILAGGSSYFLSKKAIKCINKVKLNPRSHVLEDVMISNILAKYNIYATVPSMFKVTMKQIKLKNKVILAINN